MKDQVKQSFSSKAAETFLFIFLAVIGTYSIVRYLSLSVMEKSSISDSKHQ